jgi:hypothetical protein
VPAAGNRRRGGAERWFGKGNTVPRRKGGFPDHRSSCDDPICPSAVAEYQIDAAAVAVNAM